MENHLYAVAVFNTFDGINKQTLVLAESEREAVEKAVLETVEDKDKSTVKESFTFVKGGVIDLISALVDGDIFVTEPKKVGSI